jgi:hypothetical protein
MDEHNRRRALADVASLDAWRGKVDKNGRVDLHVDVSFGVARIGGGVDEKVRFRLGVRRAELTVIIPETEPARFDRASVTRAEAPAVQVKLSETRKASRKAAAGAQLSGAIGAKGAQVKGKLSASANAAIAQEVVTKILRQSGAILVAHGKNGDGSYRWIMTPAADASLLDGQPWDSAKAPRLKIIDTRRDPSKGIEPSIRVQIRCLREDLEISNIVLKDQTLWASLIQSPTHRNRVAAAEAVIRDRLLKAGLVHGAVDEPYAELCLAEVVVGEDE